MNLGVATLSIPDDHVQTLGDATLNAGTPQNTRSTFDRALNLSRSVWESFKGFLGYRNAEYSARNEAREAKKNLGAKGTPSRDSVELERKVIEILRDVTAKAADKKIEYDQKVRPIVEEIQRAAQGQEWLTEEHQRLDPKNKGLYLASLPPKELLKGIASFEELQETLTEIWQDHGEQNGNTFVSNSIAEQILLTRKRPDGRVETLEFCFFEGHKMNVFKDGEHIGNLYYGSVKQAVELFWEGRSVSLRPVQHSKMVVQDDIVTYTTTDGAAHEFDALEFLAALSVHIPKTYESITRYYGRYSCRRRGERAKLAPPSP